MHSNYTWEVSKSVFPYETALSPVQTFTSTVLVIRSDPATSRPITTVSSGRVPPFLIGDIANAQQPSFSQVGPSAVLYVCYGRGSLWSQNIGAPPRMSGAVASYTPTLVYTFECSVAMSTGLSGGEYGITNSTCVVFLVLIGTFRLPPSAVCITDIRKLPRGPVDNASPFESVD